MKRTDAFEVITAVLNLRAKADDQTAARNVVAFPAWAAGKSYAVGERVKDEGKLYKVITAHTSQTDWKPKGSCIKSLRRTLRRRTGSRRTRPRFMSRLTLSTAARRMTRFRQRRE